MAFTFEEFATVLVTRFALDRAAITPTTTFEDLGMDSLNFEELSVILHEEAGVLIEGETLEDLARVDAVLRELGD